MELSVVIPCYNEEGNIAELYRRVKAACESATVTGYEIVLVNDGSRDGTLPAMLRLREAEKDLVIVDLSRNHGHQLALSAGLSVAKGDYVFILDADLQDPPELLTPMIARARAGVDVVYGQRQERKGETWLKLFASRAFYRVLSFLSDIPIPEDVGDFRLISRRVLDHVLAMPEYHRFLRGMIPWVGFRQEAFAYQREARFSGSTHYPLHKLLQLAIDGISSFSIRPLRVSILFALFGAALAALLALYAVYGFFFERTVAGWASLACLISFFSSLQLICLGVIGEYVGRGYIEAKRRPLFIIKDVYRG